MDISLYFNMHQPFRLFSDVREDEQEHRNREIFDELANSIYIPKIKDLEKVVRDVPKFKFGLGISGVFLDQAEKFSPELIDSLLSLRDAAIDYDQIEFLAGTYHNSLAGLFSDPNKIEFRRQVSNQRKRIREMFGENYEPFTFKNTQRRFNNDIAKVVSDMNFDAMYVDLSSEFGDNVGFDSMAYRAAGSDLLILPRNRAMSYLAQGKDLQITSKDYMNHLFSVISSSNDEIINLGLSLENVDLSLNGLWHDLASNLTENSAINVVLPYEITKKNIDNEKLPVLERPGYNLDKWKNGDIAVQQSNGLIQNPGEYDILKRLQDLESKVISVGNGKLEKWQNLTSYDVLNALHVDHTTVEGRRLSYSSSIDAAIDVTSKICELEKDVVHDFQILKRSQRVGLLVVTPEISEFDSSMGDIGPIIGAQSGGLGVLMGPLISELSKLDNFDVYVSTINLAKTFMKEQGLSEEEFVKKFYSLDHGKIFLANHSKFDDMKKAYDGDQSWTAAEFQRQVMNFVPQLQGKNNGKLLVHSHDALAGGYINAKCSWRGIPNLFTIHNVHTVNVPFLEYIHDSPELLSRLKNSRFNDKNFDTNVTGVTNAWIATTVAPTWMEEMTNGVYTSMRQREDGKWYDVGVVPQDLTNALIAKDEYNANLSNGNVVISPRQAVVNCLSPSIYPENSKFLNEPQEEYQTRGIQRLVKSYGPNDDIVTAKKNNLIAFQKYSGLQEDPNAILLMYCARLDDYQKNITMSREVAFQIINEYKSKGINVQFAFIGDGAGEGEIKRKFEEDVAKTALASNGLISYLHFSKQAEALGLAASSIGFGPSVYEPCGQNDMAIMAHGGISVYSNVGGYKDKVKELRLYKKGATRDHGNGFTHEVSYEGLKTGLRKGIDACIFLKEDIGYENHVRSMIMNDFRRDYNIDNMVLKYARMYESLVKLQVDSGEWK